MNVLLLWTLVPLVVVGWPITSAVSARLRRRKPISAVFLPANVPVGGPIPKVQTVARTTSRPNEQSARMTGSELNVLASRYLLTTAGGEASARREVLSVMTCAELAGGLSRICRTMAQELGDATDRCTTDVLEEVLERAVAQHLENVTLA